jgi:hypothetical protein
MVPSAHSTICAKFFLFTAKVRRPLGSKIPAQVLYLGCRDNLAYGRPELKAKMNSGAEGDMTVRFPLEIEQYCGPPRSPLH